MLQRFESLEMDLQKLLERLRDPLAGADGERVFVGTGRRQQEGILLFLSFLFWSSSFFFLPVLFPIPQCVYPLAFLFFESNSFLPRSTV